VPEAPPDFGSLVHEYDRHRTGYSPALLDRVLRGRAAPRVLDVGAGTGLAARDLAPRARRLVAVDVSGPMLRACPVGERALAKGEALPFRAGSFDLVTCAQAFHWLDAEAAYREFHRVLRPGGVAALWWKYEAPGDPSAAAADAAFERVVGRPAPTTSLETEPLPGLPGPFAEVEQRVIPWSLPLTVEGYVGYHASRENLRRGAGPLREKVLAEMRRALEAMHPSGRFTLAYEQRLWLLRKEA